MSKSLEHLLAKTLLEVVDNNAHLLTVLDLQARLLARLEGREEEDVVAEVNALLKARRRAALAEIDAWTEGSDAAHGPETPEGEA